MKIKDEDYAVLKAAVEQVLDAHPQAMAEYRKLERTPMRFRWDVLWKSGLKIGDGVGMSGDVNLYAYANDDHIDTALRAIMKARGLDWAATPKQSPAPSAQRPRP